jgi:hypothetical protein
MDEILKPLAVSCWDRWLWSPGFRGALTWVGVLLVFIVALLAVGCLFWRQGSGPATHAERRAFGSNWRWAYTFLAVLFPPLLGLGAWLIVFPGARPVELFLISRVLTPGNFDPERWQEKVPAVEPASDAMWQLDVGKVVDKVIERVGQLPKLPTRDELVDDGPIADEVRTILVEEIEKYDDLHQLMLADGKQPAAMTPASTLTAVPDWLIESVELACCRLLAERANVHRITIATAGRVDRFGQLTYDDARGYLAGAGSLKKEAIQVVGASMSDRDIVLLSGSRWAGERALLLFQVPRKGPAIGNPVKVFAKPEGGGEVALGEFTFTAEALPKLVPRLVNLKATPLSIEARTSNKVTTEVKLPPAPAPLEILVPSHTLPADPHDRSYFSRALEDLKTKGGVTIGRSAGTERPVQLEKTAEGIWLHYGNAKFDRDINARGTQSLLRELQLLAVAEPSLLSLDRHQIRDVEPAMPKSSGFVLAWAPAYQTPLADSGTDLLFGQVMREPVSIPLAIAMPDQDKPEESVIWLGLTPPDGSDNSIHSAAYWWTVGRLAQRCAYPANTSAEDLTATQPTGALRPVNLLDEAHIAHVSALAHSSGSMILAVALLLTSCATLVQLVLAARSPV